MSGPIWTLGEDDVQVALRSAILHATHNAPRSLQTSIGPSEVGDECLRRIAYRLTGVPRTNDGGDQWRPTVGTAVHTWLAAALEHANDALGAGDRWLVEQRVTITDWLSGSCDAYDLQTGTVVDWKVVGTTSLRKYRKDGPGKQYRDQIHLYGRGLVNAGHDVKHVAICFLPSAGSLGDTIYWTEPYDQAVADAAVTRIETLRLGLRLGATPASIPGTPVDERRCLWCPWYAYGSGDLAVGCPGIDGESQWIADTATTQEQPAPAA